MTTTGDARARFEKWYGSKPEFGNYIYVDQIVQARWEAWQAAIQPQDSAVMVPREIIDRIAGILSLTPDSYRDLMPGLFKAINDLQPYVKGEK